VQRLEVSVIVKNSKLEDGFQGFGFRVLGLGFRV